MKTRTRKALGAAVAIAAIAASVPLAITAEADPAPTAEFPDPQGPGCDAFKQQVPTYKNLHEAQTSAALAAIPDISTFYSAASGQFNPAVNVVAHARQRPVRDIRADQRGVRRAAAGATRRAEDRPADADQSPRLPRVPRPPRSRRREGPAAHPAGHRDQGRPARAATSRSTTPPRSSAAASRPGHARIYIIDTVLDPAQGPAPITPTAHQHHQHDEHARRTTTTTPATDAPSTGAAAGRLAAPSRLQATPAEPATGPSRGR